MKNKFLKLGLGVSLLMGMGLNTVAVADEEVQGAVSSSEVVQGFTWVDVRLPANMTIQELAQMYYGDENEYPVIQKANPKVVGKKTHLSKGMTIKIPVTDKFTDQPERLGWN